MDYQARDKSEITLTEMPAEKEDVSAFEMSPSMPAEKADSAELVLEAGSIFKAEEITFEGEEEAEERVGEAMAAYDKAMDQAAGLK